MHKAIKAGLASTMGAAMTVLGVAIAPTASAATSDGNVSIMSADCNTWKSGTTGYAYCSGLGPIDYFQVKVTCIDYRGNYFIQLGPTRGNGGTSKDDCDPNNTGRAYVAKTGVVVTIA